VSRWEYRRQALEPIEYGGYSKYIRMEIPERILELAGNHGWELTAVYDGMAYFKRPMEDNNGKEETEVEEAQEQEDEEDKDKQEIYAQQGEIFYRSHREGL
jgi:Ran GTPase-activating protein (RanGAP) involved in mRNA processing and transport